MSFSKKLPQLSLESFFSTKVIANGYMTFFYPIKKIKDIKIIFSGKFKNNTLILNENYQDNDTTSIRIWSFKRKSKNSYIGKEKNVVGNINVFLKGNKLSMKYKFKTNYKKFFFKVTVNDSMYLIDKHTLINKTIISKYGLTIAESLLIYKKS